MPTNQLPKYWKWEGPNWQVNAIEQVPWEIVTSFEKHGFIWGGKWNHYDTMHFEYRPELVLNRIVSPCEKHRIR